MVPQAKRPRFPIPLLKRPQGPDTFSNETLWMKPQHEGALTPPCQKTPQVPLTVRKVACHPENNSRGKQSSIPPHKTRLDSPVPTLQGPCDRSPKWRGTLRFLPQFEMRRSSIAPNQVESREASPSSIVSLTSQRHPGSYLRSQAQVEGTQGFLPQPEKDLERPFSLR